MANINVKERQNAFANATGYANAGTFLNHNMSHVQALRAQSYIPTNPPAMMAHTSADTGLTALAHSFGGLNLQQPPLSSSGSSFATNRSQVSASSEYGGVSLPQTSAYYIPSQQHMLYTGNHLQGPNQVHNGLPHATNLYAPAAHFMPQANYGNYGQHLESPTTQSWATSRVPSGEMPTLITPRRDSISSAENDHPGTPYTSYGGFNNGFAVVDRSPSVGYAHSGTPSPSQLGAQYGIPQIAKAPPTPVVSLELQQLVAREPPIPRAIPAPSSPLKPLDRSLENKNGETNVYIRGLMPETTDEMLHQWGVRFGDIQSSKAIIDLKTNLCKGFGFIKYHNFEDAENCIRGFHYLGYEVSFARESFYAKLKKFSDEGNTNLYVSNIPRNMNEHELSEIFLPYEVCSAKVLRDSSGHGRGVGFARFQSRDICEEIIRKFNNYPVTRNGEEYSIQIRYSDTHEQKMLKQQTAAARQFRAAEFEYGVAQARNVGLLPPPQQERISGLTPSEHEAANEFENFLHNNIAAGAYKPPRHGQNTLRFAPGPAFGVPRVSNLPVPQVNLPARKLANDDSAADAKPRPATPTIAHSDNSSDASNVGSEKE